MFSIQASRANDAWNNTSTKYAHVFGVHKKQMDHEMKKKKNWTRKKKGVGDQLLKTRYQMIHQNVTLHCNVYVWNDWC